MQQEGAGSFLLRSRAKTRLICVTRKTAPDLSSKHRGEEAPRPREARSPVQCEERRGRGQQASNYTLCPHGLTCHTLLPAYKLSPDARQIASVVTQT